MIGSAILLRVALEPGELWLLHREVQLALAEPDEPFAELPADRGPVSLEDARADPAAEDVHPAAVERLIGVDIEVHREPGVLHGLEHLDDGMNMGTIVARGRGCRRDRGINGLVGSSSG